MYQHGRCCHRFVSQGFAYPMSSEAGTDVRHDLTSAMASSKLYARSTLCLRCQTNSPSVYTQWMCLKPDCSAFWIDQHGGSPSDDGLIYNDRFLKLAPEPHCPYQTVDLIPQQLESRPTDGITTDYIYTRGWRCPNCNRLACR